MQKRMNGAQIVVEVLKKQGVEYIFGYPGGACIPIFDAVLDGAFLKLILVNFQPNFSNDHYLHPLRYLPIIYLYSLKLLPRDY